MTSRDFTCFPCAGKECFKLPVVERKTCTAKPHPCPARIDDVTWWCRCCDDCNQRCYEEAE